MAPVPPTKEELLLAEILAGDPGLHELTQRYTEARTQVKRKQIDYLGLLPDGAVVNAETLPVRALEKLRVPVLLETQGLLGSWRFAADETNEYALMRRRGMLPEGLRKELYAAETASGEAFVAFLERKSLRAREIEERRIGGEYTSMKAQAEETARERLRSKQIYYSADELKEHTQKTYDEMKDNRISAASASLEKLLRNHVETTSSRLALAEIAGHMQQIRTELQPEYGRAYAALRHKQAACRECADYESYCVRALDKTLGTPIRLADEAANDFLGKAYVEAARNAKNRYHPGAIRHLFIQELDAAPELRLPQKQAEPPKLLPRDHLKFQGERFDPPGMRPGQIPLVTLRKMQR